MQRENKKIKIKNKKGCSKILFVYSLDCLLSALLFLKSP